MTSIQKDIQRLTQMHKRLTLLTKIENQQFAKSENLNLNEILQKRIEDFQEIYQTDIALDERAVIKVKMDAYLADVLCDNLLSNALKHNPENKAVQVLIDDHALSFSNFGKEKLQHPERLFSRFYREAPQVRSTGLGLAIVRKICDLYGFQPSYSFRKDRHILTITFNE